MLLPRWLWLSCLIEYSLTCDHLLGALQLSVSKICLILHLHLIRMDISLENRIVRLIHLVLCLLVLVLSNECCMWRSNLSILISNEWLTVSARDEDATTSIVLPLSHQIILIREVTIHLGTCADCVYTSSCLAHHLKIILIHL